MERELDNTHLDARAHTQINKVNNAAYNIVTIR